MFVLNLCVISLIEHVLRLPKSTEKKSKEKKSKEKST